MSEAQTQLKRDIGKLERRIKRTEGTQAARRELLKKMKSKLKA